MIQFEKVFEVFRNVIKYRLEPISGPIKVIQVRTTGSKPKEVFATMDIMFIDDANSYLTNAWYDKNTQEMVYETHKSVRLQLGVRNGNPDDLPNQMAVYTLCNHLHKAFVEEAIRDYILDNLGATITSVQAIRTLSDFLPTGIGNIQAFDMIIGMNDVTRAAYVPIENADIEGNIGGETVDAGVTNPPACSGLVLTKTSGDLDPISTPGLSNYEFVGGGTATFDATHCIVRKNSVFVYSFSGAVDGDSASIMLGDENYRIQHGSEGTSVTLEDKEVFSVKTPPWRIPFIMNSDLESATINQENQQYIASTKDHVKQFEINRTNYTGDSVTRLIFCKNDLDNLNDLDDLVGIQLPSNSVDVCGNPIG